MSQGCQQQAYAGTVSQVGGAARGWPSHLEGAWQPAREERVEDPSSGQLHLAGFRECAVQGTGQVNDGFIPEDDQAQQPCV